jgi:FAD/FMN-containing dehydrogenase
LRFVREAGVPLAIKGGGHNIAGLAVCDGGLLLDMSAMRGVWVDREAEIARAQAGCLLGDVDQETQLHGLAAVLGFVSMTGVAGLTLGGGFGYMTRRHGWTVDNVTGMEVVTAGGEIVRASERDATRTCSGPSAAAAATSASSPASTIALLSGGPTDRRRRWRGRAAIRPR